MRDENCIFCRIAAGEIPSKTIYEDERFRVILDLGPVTRGHALILPKEHYRNIYELPEDVAGDVMKLAKRMTVQMTQKLHCDGFNLLQNNEEVAGQSVFHFHMHLIPRYKGDQAGFGWNDGTLKDEVKTEVLDKVRAELAKTE